MAQVRYTGRASVIRIPGGITLARLEPTTVEDELARPLARSRDYQVSALSARLDTLRDELSTPTSETEPVTPSASTDKPEGASDA